MVGAAIQIRHYWPGDRLWFVGLEAQAIPLSQTQKFTLRTVNYIHKPHPTFGTPLRGGEGQGERSVPHLFHSPTTVFLQ
ncbi:MAG: hypothetical protein OHK0047_07290 [Leptolyngbyaceae cyanobacterium]